MNVAHRGTSGHIVAHRGTSWHAQLPRMLCLGSSQVLLEGDPRALDSEFSTGELSGPERKHGAETARDRESDEPRLNKEAPGKTRRQRKNHSWSCSRKNLRRSKILASAKMLIGVGGATVPAAMLNQSSNVKCQKRRAIEHIEPRKLTITDCVHIIFSKYGSLRSCAVPGGSALR